MELTVTGCMYVCVCFILRFDFNSLKVKEFTKIIHIFNQQHHGNSKPLNLFKFVMFLISCEYLFDEISPQHLQGNFVINRTVSSLILNIL